MSHSPPLPRCCSPLCDHWPLPRPLDGVYLQSTRFDPALLQREDFARWGLEQPHGVSKRQAEFLAGRICAHEALRQLTGTPGFPTVGSEREPCWPTGVVGSITHGAGWAGAAVASADQWQGLGLDVEKVLSDARAERLASEILTSAEMERLASLDARQRALQITLTFSIKESLFKALFPIVRRRFYFHDAELVFQDSDGQARLRLLTDLSTDWYESREVPGQFSLFEDYLISLVTVSP